MKTAQKQAQSTDHACFFKIILSLILNFSAYTDQNQATGIVFCGLICNRNDLLIGMRILPNIACYGQIRAVGGVTLTNGIGEPRTAIARVTVVFMRHGLCIAPRTAHNITPVAHVNRFLLSVLISDGVGTDLLGIVPCGDGSTPSGCVLENQSVKRFIHGNLTRCPENCTGSE